MRREEEIHFSSGCASRDIRDFISTLIMNAAAHNSSESRKNRVERRESCFEHGHEIMMSTVAKEWADWWQIY
jgi:hypothetical protein